MIRKHFNHWTFCSDDMCSDCQVDSGNKCCVNRNDGNEWIPSEGTVSLCNPVR